MKRYKKIMHNILIFIVILSTTVYAQNVDKLNEQKENIDDKIKQTQEEVKEKEQEKNTLLSQVEALDDDLEKATKELDDISEKLDNTQKSLEKATKELDEANEKKETQYETLKTRMRVMYENRDTGYLQVLLDAKSIGDFFRKTEYISYIMKYDNEVLEKYEKLEDDIRKSVEKIEEDKKNIIKLKEDAEEKNRELQINIQNKKQTMDKLTKEKAMLDQKIADLKKEDADITKLINQAKVNATESSNNKIYKTTNGRFTHPVPQYAGSPYNDVYGYRKNPISGKSELHSGLDLKATYGTDVVAGDDGVVIYSGRRGGYGNTVIIDHGGGVTTLYAHNSKLVVKKGQSVKRGQVVAKAGSTGYSTGVHAHFEVRINGKHTNPVPYLK